MTDLTQAFARLIEALEKDYEMRNEGDVHYNITIDRERNFVGVYVFNDNKLTYPRYSELLSGLTTDESRADAIALCCDRLREKVEKI